MNKSIFFFYILTLPILTGCGTNNNLTALSRFNDAAEEKYSGNYSFLFNSDSSKILCFSPRTKDSGQFNSLLKYFVWDLGKQKILIESSSVNASAEWVKRNTIYIKIFNEAQSDNPNENNSSYYQNVITGIKTGS